MGRFGVRLLAVTAALAAGLALPVAASAHPLGNFTINHYAGLTVFVDHVELDIVIDMAEIPAFQERQTMDADGDGSVTDEEATAWSRPACGGLVKDLVLEIDNSLPPIDVQAASVAFPAGAGGLSTLRLECQFRASFGTEVGSRSTVLSFADTSYLDRIGWREIVATGHGTILDTNGLPETSPSQKLTSYPTDQLATPLDVRDAVIEVRVDPAGPPATPSAPPLTAAPAAPAGPSAAVPGGVGAELPAIFRSADLTPFVILASMLTAVAIGAGHALTPGHGKTLMAAYLVGSRGTTIHAVGLGLSVAVSHTLGILALALVIVGAGSVLPPDVVYRVTPVIAAVSIAAIGGWMLINEVRRRRAATAVASAHEGGHDPGHGHDHPHAHEHPHGHSDEHAHPHPGGREHDHAARPADLAVGEHRHGGVTHSHVPAAGSTLTWRGLFVLGLAGGLIPSTSALIILLGSIAAGRPAFGLVLVIAFGLGMAAVMTGVGLAMIFARSRLDRMPSRSSLGRLAAAAPLLASVAVLTLGLYLTWQAVASRPVL